MKENDEDMIYLDAYVYGSRLYPRCFLCASLVFSTHYPPCDLLLVLSYLTQAVWSGDPSGMRVPEDIRIPFLVRSSWEMLFFFWLQSCESFRLEFGEQQKTRFVASQGFVRLLRTDRSFFQLVSYTALTLHSVFSFLFPLSGSWSLHEKAGFFPFTFSQCQS